MSRKNIVQLAEYLSQIILKNTKNNYNYINSIANLFIGAKENFTPNKLRCVPKIVECKYYQNFDEFKRDYKTMLMILNNPQIIYYLKRKQFSSQKETRILFQLCYDNLILDAPEDSLILDFPNFLKKDLMNEKEIATPA